MENLATIVRFTYRPNQRCNKPAVDSDKVLLGVNLFIGKLKEKLIAGNKVLFPKHFESMAIIRVKKSVNIDKISADSSFEKYQLEVCHKSVMDGYVRVAISESFYASIKKYASETNIKYRYVNK